MARWILLCLGLVLRASAQDAFELGPYQVNTTSIPAPFTINLDKNLEVFAPNAPGNFPVYYLVSGFGGLVAGDLYSDYLSHLASHGIIGIAVWRVESPWNSFNASWWDETIEYVENKLERYLHNQGWDSQMQIDTSNSIISGHSAGSHGAVSKLQEGCHNFKGMILHSPVDGADPWGIIDMFVIEPGQKVNFSIPTYIIINQQDGWLGSVEASYGCVPEGLGDFRFFEAMSGPVWMVNTTGYGHVDFMDQEVADSVGNSAICYSDPTTDKQAYREFVAGSSVSFIRGFGISSPTATVNGFGAERSGNTESEARYMGNTLDDTLSADEESPCSLPSGRVGSVTTAVLDMAENCNDLTNLETTELHGVSMANYFNANGWERCSQTTCQNL